MKTYNIAIAGAGGIGAFHARAIADLPNATLVGAASITRELAEPFCEEFGGRPYGDVAEMLDAEKPDVVCVTTPSGAHMEPVIEAAKRGIHVICEKPLDVTAERMDAIQNACREGGVQLGSIFQQRLGPLMIAAREALAAGRVGSKPLIQASVPWWRDDDYYGPGRWQGTKKLDGGGALMNQSIHAVDMILWLAAATMPELNGANPVAAVSAFASVQGHADGLLEVEDTCLVNLQMRDGRVAQILASTAMYPGSLRRFLIGGENGTIETQEDQLLQWTFRDECPEDAETRKRFGVDTSHGGGAGDPFAMDYAKHRENIAAFLTALDQGKSPAVGGHQARQAVDVILAAYASAEQGGAPVHLN